jgi:hypothetical protein
MNRDGLELTPLDDLPFHQAIAPFPIPATSDTHFNDGYYFGFFTRGWFAFLGLRLYPNTNVMDGYGGVVADGEQRTVRASRALRPRAQDLAVGPISVEVVEGLKEQRIVLGPNDQGVEFDITISATHDPFFESPDIHHRRGRLLNHVLRYTQLGRAAGMLRVGGTEVPVDRWYAVRDHSWGIRASMGPVIPVRGVERSRGDPRAIRIWMPFELGDRRGLFALHEDSDGNVLDFDGMLEDADGSRVELVSARHAFEYRDGSRLLRRGSVTLTDEAEREIELTFEVVGDPAAPQGFGYVRGWGDGEPPGVYRGAEHVESDRFTTGDPSSVAGPERIPAERRLGAAEFPAIVRDGEGREGMAQIEHMVYRPYRPYGFA